MIIIKYTILLVLLFPTSHVQLRGSIYFSIVNFMCYLHTFIFASVHYNFHCQVCVGISHAVASCHFSFLQDKFPKEYRKTQSFFHFLSFFKHFFAYSPLISLLSFFWIKRKGWEGIPRGPLFVLIVSQFSIFFTSYGTDKSLNGRFLLPESRFQ